MVRPANLQNIELPGARGKVAKFIENRCFTGFITAVILLNAATLGLETKKEVMDSFGSILLLLDQAALSIFAVEMLLKIFTYRLSFFRAGWNVFDLIVISIAFIPATGLFSIVRALRVLRVLRLVSVVPQMRRVISALLHSIPGMASIMAVLLIIFYVAAVLVTTIFGSEFETHFGTIEASMFTLFQIMTLEGWSDEIVRPVMEIYPLAWIFFIPFIVITSFAVLNLFIGIIVDAMNLIHETERIYTGPDRRKNPELVKEIKTMRKEIEELKELLTKTK